VHQRPGRDAVRTRREKGLSGMGLPMVYGIVKNHNGGVHVESSPGEGSSFTIHLPAPDPPPNKR